MARRLDPQRLAGLRRIGIDEFSYRKRHRYLTVVVDHDRRRVVWTGEGKSSETLAPFFELLGEERCKEIETVTIDLSAAFIKAVRDSLPHAETVFDRFHVQRLASDALDEVRRSIVLRYPHIVEESQKRVGGNGNLQWPADVNGDGLSDLLYNRAGSAKYWVMLANSDGTFQSDKKAGSRDSNNSVGGNGDLQWLADVNGDGLSDLLYNLAGSAEYWVMLANSDGTFQSDMKAGSRDSNNSVGGNGNLQWPADVNGDGRATLLYNLAGSIEYWVVLFPH